MKWLLSALSIFAIVSYSIPANARWILIQDETLQRVFYNTDSVQVIGNFRKVNQARLLATPDYLGNNFYETTVTINCRLGTWQQNGVTSALLSNGNFYNISEAKRNPPFESIVPGSSINLLYNKLC